MTLPDTTNSINMSMEVQRIKDRCIALISTEANTASFKEALKQGTEQVHALFDKGAHIKDVIHLQTRLIDNVLIAIWEHFFSLEQRQSMALVAVGGYGRGELHPKSDIDIMVLLKDSESRALNDDISGFITQLWDLGLDIGHSVRTVDECISESINDLTVITNLMEARHLEGNEALFKLMMESLGPDKTWIPYHFFQGKMKEQAARRDRFHDTAYRLEPNIKESPGGLRDIQTIGWISKRYFGTERLHDLVEEDFLNNEEYESLIDGQYLLWKIRYLLHRISGRREDRLLFDFQRDLAHKFGYTDDENNRSIEGFMQSYYRTVMQMQRLNEIVLQRFQEVLKDLRTPSSVAPINERFQINNGYLEVRSETIFETAPEAMLEIFQIYARSMEIKGIRANTIRLIRNNLDKIDDTFRDSIEARKLFMQIFRDPKKLTRKLRRMNRYGVMAAYLPDFENIVGRMQYDLFHIYTVDEHTTRVIRNLRRFALPSYRNELPHCSMIMDQIRKPELLYIIGLFHDIAKGRGGDHSELGAEAVITFCENHFINKEDTEVVQWTVRNHLIMSTTAQRRDISDPEVIHDFATRVGTRRKLNHLYLMTVADIRATNPELWNSWKENLIRDLFKYTARALHRGLDTPVDKDAAIEQKRKDASELLKEQLNDTDKNEITQLWDGLGEDYFLRYFADEIAWHSLEILNHSGDSPLIAIRHDRERGSSEVLIYAHDHAHLFSLLVAELDSLGLNILAANIGTTNTEYALNTFSILERDDKPISDEERVIDIKSGLRSCILCPDKLPNLQEQFVPRRLRHFQFEPTITIDNEISERFTSIYIEAADRPGILSRIGRCFLSANILVHSAKVSTLGEKIEDVFYVTDQNHKQLQDEKLIFELHDCFVIHLTDTDPT